jgi:hypothetical protein
MMDAADFDEARSKLVALGAAQILTGTRR